jgi:Fic-DOC domain mobile mystery protein B
MKPEYPPGATPLDADELAQLIPRHITLQRELNELEEANILLAISWLGERRRGDPLDEAFVHRVHKRMFSGVWRWAGTPRHSDKNIGAPWFDIPACLRTLLDDVRFQVQHATWEPRELAARYHHRLVAIHLYPNGNGRHARIMADLLMQQLTGHRLDWGTASLATPGERRAQYIAALQAADRGDYKPLLAFVRPATSAPDPQGG